ncbi:MAG: M16 family metallopeptidase [Actinomycetes bacterium]
MVSEAMPASRTFSVGFFVDVGSRQESDPLHGASHFLEHVLFKGTARRAAEEISAELESVGGDLNAYTSKEHTCFHARVLGADAERSVDVLTDMLTASRVRSADVEAERAVILDEIAMHGDDPGETVQELVTGRLFGPSGLGRSVIGSEASVAAMPRSAIVRHWRRHYRPDSLVVSAAGAVDHDGLLAQLDGLATEQAVPAARRAPPTVLDYEGGLAAVVRPLEQCTVSMGVPGAGVFDDRRYPIGILTTILGGGMASRLFVEVRERRGLAYGIDAADHSFTDAGLVSVDWQCSPENLVEIAGLVRAACEDLAERGVTPAEMARAQGQMRGQTVLAYESPNSRMNRLGRNTLIGDDRSLEAVLDAFDAVTAEAVQAEAVRLFAQPVVLGVVGPRLAGAATRALRGLVRP